MVSRLRAVRAYWADAGMCAFLNAVHLRHRVPDGARDRLAEYVAECERLGPEQYYRAAADAPSVPEHAGHWRWPSPVTVGLPRNDHAHVEWFPCARGPAAPTALILHALMSASSIGYIALARRFNARGWNAAFVHLPFHYERRPPGTFNGELAVSPDFVRSGQGLRQAVVELRQVTAALRRAGCPGFGVWGTSYGAWVGGLLALLEPDLRFLVLMTPIADVAHAVWESPALRSVRWGLRRAGIEPELVERHSHLSALGRRVPPTAPDRILLLAGAHDRITPAAGVRRLAAEWGGVPVETLPQGHFGYRLARRAWEWGDGKFW